MFGLFESLGKYSECRIYILRTWWKKDRKCTNLRNFFSLFHWILWDRILYCTILFFSMRNLPHYPMYCGFISRVRSLCTPAFVQKFYIWGLLLIIGLCPQVRQDVDITQNTLIYSVNIWISGEFIGDSLAQIQVAVNRDFRQSVHWRKPSCWIVYNKTLYQQAEKESFYHPITLLLQWF